MTSSILIYLLFTSVGSQAYAQEPASESHPSVELSLQSAFSLAQTGNQQLATGRARLEQASVGIKQARAVLLPTASIQLTYTHHNDETSLQIPTSLTSTTTVILQPGEQIDAGLAVSAPLVAPSAWFMLASARESRSAADARYEALNIDILHATAQAFYAAAGADELMEARQHALEVARAAFHDVQTRETAGMVTRVEIRRAELAVVRAEQGVVETIALRQSAYRALTVLIGVDTPIQVVPPDLESLPSHSTFSSRSELTAVQHTLAAAQYRERSARWRWSPTLSAFGTAVASNNEGFTGKPYFWAAGLQLGWAIYDGGLRDAAKHQALAERHEAEAQFEQLQRQITAEIADAEQAVVTKRLAFQSATRSVELAEETLDLVTVQHRAGTATQLDLLSAQDMLVSSEVSVAQARFDLALAMIEVQRANGTFLGEFSP